MLYTFFCKTYSLKDRGVIYKFFYVKIRTYSNNPICFLGSYGLKKPWLNLIPSQKEEILFFLEKRLYANFFAEKAA